jgi:hypothetical protein
MKITVFYVCDDVYFSGLIRTLRSKLLSPSSGLKDNLIQLPLLVLHGIISHNLFYFIPLLYVINVHLENQKQYKGSKNNGRFKKGKYSIRETKRVFCLSRAPG